MPEVEFVNPELAKSEAARAIGLLNSSAETKGQAWVALRAVADQVGEASNTGVKGITWQARRPGERSGTYYLNARCQDGRLKTTFAAPATLDEARQPEHLDRIITIWESKVSELGGLSQPLRRPSGTGMALAEAVAASAEGQAWLGRHRTRYGAVSMLLRMVTVADAYGDDGIYPFASAAAHEAFLPFDNRAELIREFPSVMAARAKAMSLRGERHDLPADVPRNRVRDSEVTRLAVRTGVTRAEARTILRALADGRSKTKLIRAVNEAVRMGEMKAQTQAVAA